MVSKSESNLHLTHLEDNIIDHGPKGYDVVKRKLYGIHDLLKGKKTSTSLSVKQDGSPAIFSGYKDGKFFVATKSIFNKNAKINHNISDIEKNHGHAPGLVSKLKDTLIHLPKVIPNNGKIYQGDLMYSKDGVHYHDDKLSFKPNTITYSVNKDSDHGKKIQKSKIGIAFHTTYDGHKVNFGVDQDELNKHQDVHLFDPKFTAKPTYYKPEHQKAFLSAIKDADAANSKIQPGDHEALEKHRAHMNIYINHTVKNSTIPSAKGYSKFLSNRKESSKVEQAKTAILFNHSKDHSDKIQRVLDLHQKVQHAKHSILHSIDSHEHDFTHTISNRPSKPEGYVASDKNRASKLINRSVFSAANFDKSNKSKKINESKHSMIVESLIKKLFESKNSNPEKTMVMSYARMNPPTPAHAKVVEKIHELARKHNAEHGVFISGTQDKNKNPLSIHEKIKHITRMFPNTHIIPSTKESPTLIHHLKTINQKGYSHVHIVVGGDRHKEINELVNKYNNGKDYNFKSITVHNAGDRDETKNDLSGMSASKVRGIVQKGDFKQFKNVYKEHIPNEHIKELFSDLSGKINK